MAMGTCKVVIVSLVVALVAVSFTGIKMGGVMEQFYEIFYPGPGPGPKVKVASEDTLMIEAEEQEEAHDKLLFDAQHGSLPAVESLMEEMVSRYSGKPTPQTDLHRAAQTASETCRAIPTCLQPLKEVVEQVKESDLYMKDKDGNTFLHSLFNPFTTINSKQLGEIVQFLVGKGHARLFNELNNFKATPFQLAVRYLEGDKESSAALALLQKNQVDFNNNNVHGSRPLNYAVTRGRGREVLSNLIEFGASYDYRNKMGYSLLHDAAGVANLAAVKFFVEKGLDVNGISREDKYTPLHLDIGGQKAGLRSFDKRVDVVKYLVEGAGASLEIRDGNGNTPYELAEMIVTLPDRDAILKIVKI